MKIRRGSGETVCNHFRWLAGLIVLACLGGCAGNQVYSNSLKNNIALAPGDLENHGVAFITPSTVTGQEEDTQMLALAFAVVLEAKRPAIPLVKLSETLSAINQHKLSENYKKMYSDYRDTGIFISGTLSDISHFTQARYLVQLKLSSFQQGSASRWDALGLRIVQTKTANIRLFMQIWDGATGAIVWEGNEEFNYAYDTSAEKPITFRAIVEMAASHLILGLPPVTSEPMPGLK